MLSVCHAGVSVNRITDHVKCFKSVSNGVSLQLVSCTLYVDSRHQNSRVCDVCSIYKFFPTNLHFCLYHYTKANYYKYKVVKYLCLPLKDFIFSQTFSRPHKGTHV